MNSEEWRGRASIPAVPQHHPPVIASQRRSVGVPKGQVLAIRIPLSVAHDGRSRVRIATTSVRTGFAMTDREIEQRLDWLPYSAFRTPHYFATGFDIVILTNADYSFVRLHKNKKGATKR